MYCQIRQLRAHGKRRPEREFGADPGVFGCIRIYTVASTRQATAHPWGDFTHQQPLYPTLYEPVIASMDGSSMLIRGLQVEGDAEGGKGCTVLQEWVVTFIGLNPPA